MTRSRSRFSGRVIGASVVALATASTLAVAPAQALTNTVENSTCTITLSASEQSDWDAAVAKTNDIDEGSIMPLTVKVANAKSVKADFERKMGDLDNDKASYEAELVNGDPDESRTELLNGNIAVISQLQNLSGAYSQALSSCAKGTDTGNAETSSTMSNATLYTLLGMLGIAVATVVAAFIANGGMASLSLPGLPL